MIKLGQTLVLAYLSKRAFIPTILSLQSSKSFYAYLRSKQSCKDKVGPLKDSAGNVLQEDKAATDLLNNYFASVFTNEDITNIPEPEKILKEDPSIAGLKEIQITEELVYTKLSELNVNKCSGPDHLHPKLLYELRFELCKPLSELFKLSIELGK